MTHKAKSLGTFKTLKVGVVFRVQQSRITDLQSQKGGGANRERGPDHDGLRESAALLTNPTKAGVSAAFRGRRTRMGGATNEHTYA